MRFYDFVGDDDMANGGKFTWKTALLVVIVTLSFLGVVIGLTQLNISADDEGIRSRAMLPLYDNETLRVETVNGVINYATWDGDEVDIEAVVQARALTNAQARRYTEQVQVDIARTANGVAAVARFPDNMSHLNVVSVDFYVRVPEAWRGAIELRTNHGAVTANDLHGDAIVETHTGPISIQSHIGSLQASTSNGAINLNDVQTTLAVYTDNGSIDVNRAVLHGQGLVQTLNGSVRIRGGLDETAALRVDTSKGNVWLRLDPTDVAFDLAASNGWVRMHADVPASVQQSDKFVGRIGTGAAELLARSNNGSIDVYLADNAAL